MGKVISLLSSGSNRLSIDLQNQTKGSNLYNQTESLITKTDSTKKTLNNRDSICSHEQAMNSLLKQYKVYQELPERPKSQSLDTLVSAPGDLFWDTALSRASAKAAQKASDK